ncbi:xanthine phosphoribosyltransferase [Peptacetobacter hominis]|uniref:Xanthine phosphoribosyltransferase n=1 Tax=Peptacetobacter hominis TaxID=2743610 RepID=A0A544QYG4_9FIRM|nr:xanthine phosphoribosyltransferase [Peptacetobacter hominis]TQQ85797.1 xanthine phosphoribosyltransferase [Peptacetobacter hominis]
MELLKKKILDEGAAKGSDIIQVGSFLNHQLDIDLLNEIGKEFAERFKDVGKIDKILTIESSGIAIASIASQYFGNVPVVFAKKVMSSNMDTDVYETTVYSYTKGIEYSVRVNKKYINKGEKVIVIDDFLAKGGAVMGLKDIVDQAEAELMGVGIVIAKAYQEGKPILEANNIRVETLVSVEAINDGVITFSE